MHENTSDILGANGQISAGSSLRSPTAADGRKALCHFLAASPANTPPSSQYLQQQKHLCNLIKMKHPNHINYRASTYLWFHSACWEYSGLQDAQQEQFSRLHSFQKWRSCSEPCPQLHVGASLETPTGLTNKTNFTIKIFTFLYCLVFRTLLNHTLLYEQTYSCVVVSQTRKRNNRN